MNMPTGISSAHDLVSDQFAGVHVVRGLRFADCREFLEWLEVDGRRRELRLVGLAAIDVVTDAVEFGEMEQHCRGQAEFEYPGLTASFKERVVCLARTGRVQMRAALDPGFARPSAHNLKPGLQPGADWPGSAPPYRLAQSARACGLIQLLESDAFESKS